MARRNKNWLFRYHGFQSAEGYAQITVWTIIFVVGFQVLIWFARLFDWFEKKVWEPIDAKLDEVLGEEWVSITILIFVFIVLPLGINLYRHGLKLKNWT